MSGGHGPGGNRNTPGSSEQTQIIRRGRATDPPVTVIRVLTGSGTFQFWTALPGTTGVIGRGPEADLVVQDPSVSRSHARVEVSDQGALTILDLRSTNGTFVNGAQVQGRAPIQAGDRLLVGGVTVTVEVLGLGAVEDLRRAADRLDAADRDPLTGLVSRRWLDEQLAAFVDRHQRAGEAASCVFIDLDGFKEVNDHLGHAMGDEVLKTVADIILRTIRDGDVALRYGGDELVVFLTRCRVQEGLSVANRLRTMLEATTWTGIARGSVTLSAGVAEYRGESPAAWIERADIALYRAKRAGRNRTVSD